MKKSFHIADLIARKIKGNINAQELKELNSWIEESPENLLIYNRAIDKKVQLSKLEVYNLFNADKSWKSLENELFKTKTIQFTTQKFLKYAAVILFPMIITGSIAYYFLAISNQTNLAELDNSVKPGSQKAVLILADGGQLELNNENPLSTIEQGDSKIKNEKETLIYSVEEENTSRQELIYNELKTPRGGGYNLKLADGTEVWLNAGSSLKFPVAFTDSTRQVFLEGEAFFDVSHNGKPFIVSTVEMDVRVLGTTFNISAYTDDQEVRTTLVEGKVSVQLNNDQLNSTQVYLSSSKQAVINKVTSEVNVEEVNTAQYTSWMNGKLEFNNETLEEVMKRLARWYDFNYEFENNKTKKFHFTARIKNSENISTVLEMLQMTTEVKFKIKENTIVIH